MAKIFKSANISIDSSQQVVLNIPYISQGLRDFVLGAEGPDGTYGTAKAESYAEYSVEGLYVQSVISNAKEEAEKIIAEARHQASMILADSRAAADEIYLKSKKTGFEYALSVVNDEFAIIRSESTSMLAEVMEEVCETHKVKLDAIEAEIIDLAVMMAEKVICYELDRSEEAMKSIIEDAVSKIRIKNGIIVKTSKGKAETVRNMQVAVENGIQVKGKNDYAEYECIIESMLGRLDVSWNKKLQRIRDMISGDET